MKPSRPSITIAIPCYNQEKYIYETIQKALHQTQPVDEILVVDDGSTDTSREILNQLPVNQVHHGTNLGLSEARNTAIKHAASDIILFIDSDGHADEHLVETILETYTSNSDPNLAGVGGQGIENNINTLYDQWRALHASQGYGRRERSQVPHLYGLCMSYWRHILENVGGFSPAFRNNAEDVYIGHTLNSFGYHLAYTPRAIVYHQRTDNHSSLFRSQYNWYYWGFLAKATTHASPWTLLLGTLRRLLRDPIQDLIIHRNSDLAKLSVQISMQKIKAIVAASRYYNRDKR